MRLTVLLVLFVLLVNGLMHKPWLDSFLFAVALAVDLTPELLPMVVSVTLSRGALLMAKKRVIVKRLAAIQNLGSMDVPVHGRDRHAERGEDQAGATCLVMVEAVKQGFYRWHGVSGKTRSAGDSLR